ncbi:helix-turn-helix transcriptional regulator [Mesorhizobium sp. B2-4-7]|uniref:helix-turn-helix domain-containing protein n=1 Tax=Mesorhizobium sp. B2-4-7 TaxID=2589942 RepID=UPI00112941A1|nr:helix-turn-helix transcriptional regulator [Mesorhizobium sp. B2-4-7]
MAAALGINEGTYKAHERGRNGFGVADARRYARLFNVSLTWLNFNIGSPDDSEPLSNADRLREIFARAAEAPEPIQEQIISFAEFQLDRYEKSLETATSPAA